MAVKYYCDLCDEEVARKALLTKVNMPEIDFEEVREFNRNDLNDVRPMFDKEICIKCRVAIVKFAKTLKPKSELL